MLFCRSSMRSCECYFTASVLLTQLLVILQFVMMWCGDSDTWNRINSFLFPLLLCSSLKVPRLPHLFFLHLARTLLLSLSICFSSLFTSVQLCVTLRRGDAGNSLASQPNTLLISTPSFIPSCCFAQSIGSNPPASQDFYDTELA